MPYSTASVNKINKSKHVDKIPGALKKSNQNNKKVFHSNYGTLSSVLYMQSIVFDSPKLMIYFYEKLFPSVLPREIRAVREANIITITI